MCWYHCLRPWSRPPVGSCSVLSPPLLGGSGPPLVARTQFRCSQWVALLSAQSHHEEPTSRTYLLGLPRSLLGVLLVPSDLPRTSLLIHAWQSHRHSQLTPAPGLSAVHLFSVTVAVSYPRQLPDPLRSHAHVQHPVLVWATCSRGCRAETLSGRGFSHLAPVTVSMTDSTGQSPFINGM